MPVPNKWIYVVLLLFVVFLISNSPEAAGTTARLFFGWLGEILGGIFDFLDGLFDDNTTGEVVDQTPVTSGTSTGIDEFNPNPELN